MPQIEEVCDIGSQRELFVDHYLIDRLDGTSLQATSSTAGGGCYPVRSTVGGPSSFLYNGSQGR